MIGRVPSPEAIATAIARIEATLFSWPVLEAIIARREAGVPQPADAANAAVLARELTRFAGPDGSWGSDMLWTAESLLLMRELVPEPAGEERRVVDAGCAWLLARQDQPGRFGEGCDPIMHEAALCEHFVTGFFSASPPGATLAGVTLASGGRFPNDGAARFGISCLALQALLVWGVRDPAVDRHLTPLRAIIARHAPAPNGPIDLAAYAVGVAAVAEATTSEPGRVAALAGLTRLAAQQRADGSWPGVDLFHVLQVLLRATRLLHRLPAADAAILRAAGMLSLMVGDEGWGRGTGPERTLTGWRVFRHAHRIATD
jgi:hypothetical protein